MKNGEDNNKKKIINLFGSFVTFKEWMISLIMLHLVLPHQAKETRGGINRINRAKVEDTDS